MSIPQTQAALLSWLFSNAPIEQKAKTLEFSLSGEFSGAYYAAYTGLASHEYDRDVNLVFTLATHGDSAFLSLVASEVLPIARTLANLEDKERAGKRLALGNVVVTPDPQLQSRGFHAVLLLRVSTLPDFKNFPDSIELHGRQIRFALAVFLSAEEYQFWKTKGQDALMERFEDQNKDLVI